MNKINHLLNLASVYKHYILRKEKLSYMPLKLWVETSSRCNLNCSLCVNSSLNNGQKGDMDYKLFKKIIDQAATNIGSLNLFHRGEPFMNPELIRLIKYAEGCGIKTSVHTNATLLNGKLSAEILGSGLDFISFSFDGYTREIYENNRPGADFKKTLGNVRNFLEQKKKTGSRLPYAVIQVMGDSNGKNKQEFLSNFRGLPLNRLIERSPHNWGGILADKKPAGKPVGLCTFPWYSLTIFYDGKVSICPQDFLGKLIIGNVRKDSLSDIFNSEKAVNIRKKMANGMFYEKEPCMNCDRITRNTLLGIPVGNVKTFIRENLG